VSGPVGAVGLELLPSPNLSQFVDTKSSTTAEAIRRIGVSRIS
jgi:hypothetical protein